MALSKEQILAADDLPRVRVDVPEWAPAGTPTEDAFVFVRMLTAAEMDEYDGETYKLNGGATVVNRQQLTARLLVRALCDEKGAPLFSAKEVGALGKKGEAPMARCEAAARRISKMDKEAAEELANPTGGPANSLSTDSPGTSESETQT